MGCDIHIVMESRVPGGPWELVGKHAKVREDGYTRIEVESPYSGCNYDVFAILADVLNGRGFAGVSTGQGFVPISSPRGIPEDASPEVTEWSDDNMGPVGHSHSWLTLADLESFDWKQRTTKRGVVDAGEFANFMLTGRPNSWSGSVSGSSVRNISNEEMRAHVESLRAIDYPFTDRWSGARQELGQRLALGVNLTEQEKSWASAMRMIDNVFTSVVWEVSYDEVAQDFLDQVLPKMRALRDEQGRESRLVFHFDN